MKAELCKVYVHSPALPLALEMDTTGNAAFGRSDSVINHQSGRCVRAPRTVTAAGTGVGTVGVGVARDEVSSARLEGTRRDSLLRPGPLLRAGPAAGGASELPALSTGVG